MSDPIDLAIDAERMRQEAVCHEEQLRRQTGFELLSVFKGATCEAIDDAVERMMMLWRWYDPALSRDRNPKGQDTEEWLGAKHESAKSSERDRMTHDSKTLTRLLEEAIDRVIDDLNYERVGLRSIIRDNLTLRKRVEELEAATLSDEGLVERFDDLPPLLQRLTTMADDIQAVIRYTGVDDVQREIGQAKLAIQAQAAQIAELRRERDEAQRRDERVREAMFVLSDRLNRIGALDSDNVHAAYEKVVAALTNNGGSHNG